MALIWGSRALRRWSRRCASSGPSYFPEPQRARFVAHDEALRFEVELNGLGPPNGLATSREKVFRQDGGKALADGVEGHAGRVLGNDFQIGLAHGAVHCSVDGLDQVGMVEVLDVDLMTCHGFSPFM